MTARILHVPSCMRCDGRCNASMHGWRNVYCEMAEEPYNITEEDDKKGFPDWCPLHPDPLPILQEWFEAYERGGLVRDGIEMLLKRDIGDCDYLDILKAMIAELMRDPEAVIGRGKKEGWLK